VRNHGPILGPAVTAAQVSGYSPAQMRHAYGFDSLSTTGAGQTIAIEDGYGSPNIQSDLNTFCAHFGLPRTTIQIAYPDGKPSQRDSGWAEETTLDVEWAHAIAPGAKILLVVDNGSWNSTMAAVDYAAAHAGQVSMSWGYGEFNGESSYDSHFNKSGVTFVAASGDTGRTGEWPAACPTVVGVGGTVLSLNSAGTRLAETAWSDSSGGRTGFETEPAGQREWQSSGQREMPDVAYNADPGNEGVPIYDSVPCDGYVGWYTVGGTSAGTCQWAALFALANSQRAHNLSGAVAALYALGTPATLTSNFFPIVTGANREYEASAGYNMVTGLGTPRAAQLIPALVVH
jgi:subtilase family serine protease